MQGLLSAVNVESVINHAVQVILKQRLPDTSPVGVNTDMTRKMESPNVITQL